MKYIWFGDFGDNILSRLSRIKEWKFLSRNECQFGHLNILPFFRPFQISYCIAWPLFIQCGISRKYVHYERFKFIKIRLLEICRFQLRGGLQRHYVNRWALSSMTCKQLNAPYEWFVCHALAEQICYNIITRWLAISFFNTIFYHLPIKNAIQ